MTRMVASLIMAAGIGSRMGGEHHKCLTEIKGDHFIQRQMKKLKDALDVGKFFIVVGHKAADIESALGDEYEGVPIQYVHNKHYEDYGSGYSLMLGLRALSESSFRSCDLIVTEGDCLVPTFSYMDLQVESGSACLVGPKIDITKSVLVTVHADDPEEEVVAAFVYDRSHRNVFSELQSGQRPIGESIQTWYFCNEVLGVYLGKARKMIDAPLYAKESSNLAVMNQLLSEDEDLLSMKVIPYDGIFINLNTLADVELAESLDWT